MAEIDIPGGDGFFTAYRAPAKSGSGPGIVLIQEIFGVNKVMRDIADALAAQGFTVFCPDLFWRQEPNVQLDAYTQDEWNQAFALYQGFDEAKGVEDIAATIAALRKDPACTGKVGAVGYCLGGKLAYLAATRTDVDCAVGYYGVGIEKALDEAANIKNPLMLHIAGADGYVPPEAQQQIHAALDGNAKVTLHGYPGCDHAFAREGGDHYDAAAATEANARTLEFLRQHLMAAEAKAARRPASPSRVKAAARVQQKAKGARKTPKSTTRSAAPRSSATRKSAAQKKAAAKKSVPKKPAAKKPARKASATKPTAKRSTAKAKRR